MAKVPLQVGRKQSERGVFLLQLLPSGKRLWKSFDAGWSGLGKTPSVTPGTAWLCTAHCGFLHSWTTNSHKELTNSNSPLARGQSMARTALDLAAHLQTHTPFCRKGRGPTSLLMSPSNDRRQCVAPRKANRPSAPMERLQFTLGQSNFASAQDRVEKY